MVISGIAIIGVMAWRPRAFSRWAMRATVAITTLGLVAICTRTAAELPAPAIAGLLIVATHGLLLWRTHDVMSLAPLLIPTLLLAPSAIPTHKGWIAVMAAFALLAVGTSISYLRVRRQRRPKPSEYHATPTPVTVSALEPISV
jgi:hypothetical protein